MITAPVMKELINFWVIIYNGYESNGDTNKPLSVEEYLSKIRPY